MLLHSTNNKNLEVSFNEAVLSGLAPDGGLFMPKTLPKLPAEFFSALPGRSLPEISFDIAQALLKDDVPADVLQRIVHEAINFDAPLVRLSPSPQSSPTRREEAIGNSPPPVGGIRGGGDTYVLELFHGPTLAFKDFGARFMARLMGHFVADEKRELTILVATSGDTGSAVAHGFLNVPGIRVFILYPSGGVSPTQEKMLTTLGGNITALEIQGTFDDCQKLVKSAFVDNDLREKLFMSSANSINIARLIPQSFYYFYAYGQLIKEHSTIRANGRMPESGVVISVPSGNFGHLTAGLMAKRMGLPVAKFVAACNANDVFPDYLRTGKYTPRPSQKTLSNAMDVGAPSNFARILELYDTDVEKMRADVWSIGCTDEQTRAMIKEVYEKYEYVLDPHGAVGYWGLQQYRMYGGPSSERSEDGPRDIGIFFATASAAKFPETVEEVLGLKIDVPARMRDYQDKEKQAILLNNEFSELKQVLLR